MKVLLFLLSFLLAYPVAERKCQITCSGIADNFTQYRGDSRVLVLKVDLTHCGLRSVSTVSTWLSCANECHTIWGVQNIYGLSPDGFQIYPIAPNRLTVADAKRMRAQVHYLVTGEC